MTRLSAFQLISVAFILGAPRRARSDDGRHQRPAVVESHGLRARLDVLRPGEIDLLFGGDASTRIGVLELRIDNRGTRPASVERRSIRLVTPDRQDMGPMSPLRVANLTRPGPAMISTGSNAVDALTLILGLVKLAQNYEVATRWNHLMPETLEVAAGEERRMLLAFSSPHWAPGTSRIELPFTADSGAQHLSIPLTFKTAARPAN